MVEIDRQRQATYIERCLRIFHPLPGEAVELRALRVAGKKAVCEVHGDLAELARRACELDAAGATGCYFSLNPLHADLAGWQESRIKASDVLRRHWLPIDCDSDKSRPSGTNANEPEKEAGWRVLDRCRGMLDGAGLGGAVVADSGNGWHLCYPIDLPNDEASQELLKSVLAGLQQRAGEDLAGVTPSVHDAPRIWKLYGTRARKGPHTPDRPHRWAKLIEGQPWDAQVAGQNVAALQALLASWRFAESARQGRPAEEVSVVERAQKYVEKMPPAISGQGGHTATFEVAQVLARGFGLQRSESWPILCSYNARCVPAWSEAELLHKIETAEKDSRLPLGYLLANSNSGTFSGASSRTGRLSMDPVPPPPEPTVPPFPLEVLPPWLRRFCEEGSRALCCPVDYLAVSLLCAAGSAVGASRALRLTPDWWVLPALYVAVVAPPGSAKSPALGRVLSAVRFQQIHAFAQFKQRRKLWEQKPAEERGDKPVFQRTYTSDVTTEKLVSILHDCPRGLLYHRDELLSWIGSMDQYREGGKGADRQVYMALWDHQSLSIERKNHDDGLPMTVQRPCLSVIGTIQPDVIHRLTTQKGEQDGFVERILFTFPEANQERVWHWSGISKEARDAWRNLAGKLYALEMADPLEEGDDPWPRFLELDSGGKAAWEEWYTHWQTLRADLPASLHAVHSKMESYCARLALLLELLWYCHDAPRFDPAATPDVQSVSVEAAGQLMSYFLEHARRVYGCMQVSQADRRIDQVMAWIRKQGGGQISARDLLRHRVGAVRKATEALKLIEELVDRGLGTATPVKADNGREVVYFQPYTSDSAYTGKKNSVDSVDTVSTASVDAIFVGAQGLRYSVDSVDSPGGIEGVSAAGAGGSGKADSSPLSPPYPVDTVDTARNSFGVNENSVD